MKKIIQRLACMLVVMGMIIPMTSVAVFAEEIIPEVDETLAQEWLFTEEETTATDLEELFETEPFTDSQEQQTEELQTEELPADPAFDEQTGSENAEEETSAEDRTGEEAAAEVVAAESETTAIESEEETSAVTEMPEETEASDPYPDPQAYSVIPVTDESEEETVAAQEQEAEEVLLQDLPEPADDEERESDAAEQELAAANDAQEPASLEEPRLLSVQSAVNGIQIKWEAVPGASGYHVLFWKASTKSWAAFVDTADTEYTDTTAQPGKRYFYTVQAYNSKTESTYHLDGLSGAYIPPVKITKISSDGKNVTMSWKASSYADGYRIYWRYKGSTGWKKWKDVTDTSFTGNGGAVNKTYEYILVPYKTISGDTCFGSYQESDRAVITMLAEPEVKSVKSTAKGITLKWKAVEGAKGYNLLYWHVKSKSWKKFASTTSTSYTDTTAREGVRYYYAVQAYDGSGVSTYSYSGYAAAYLPAVTFTGIQADAKGITYEWNGLGKADGYTIYWRYKGDSKWKKYKDVTGTSNLEKAKVLKNGSVYEYNIWPYVEVGGVKYHGTWDENNRVSIAWISAPVLKSAKAVDKGIQISWSKVSGAKSYDIFWWHPNKKAWVKFAETTGTSYVDTTAKAGKLYWYTVRACTKDGKSGYDKTGLAAVYLPAARMTDAKYTGSAVKLTWKKVSGATGYRLYWRYPDGKWKSWKDVTGTSYTDSTAKKGKTYEYGVWPYVEVNGKRYYGCWDESSYKQVTAVKTTDPVLKEVSLGTGVVYYISTALGNKVVEVANASTAAGTNVQLYSQNSGGGQMWILQSSDQEGYFTIRNVKSWNCLDVNGGKSSKGGNVEQKAYDGSSSQLWTILPAGDGSCYIVNKDGYYLNVSTETDSNGANINIWSKTSEKAEKFRFTGAGQGSGVDFSNDGTASIGFRTFVVEDGNVTETDGYYHINTTIELPSGGYSLSTANIGLKVMYVNSYLAYHGYLSSGYINYNRFDGSTSAAVQQFQADHGLYVDGIVGLQTWLAMGYSEDEWYNLGTYVTPLKVNKYLSSRSDYINVMVNTAAEYANSGTGFKDGASGKPGTYVDCSGLIYQCLYAAGINPVTNIVDHALAVYEYTSRYLAADPKLGQVVNAPEYGDLMFYGSGGIVNHVAIYAGNGMIYDSWPGIGVTLRSQGSGGTLLKIIRPF